MTGVVAVEFFVIRSEFIFNIPNLALFLINQKIIQCYAERCVEMRDHSSLNIALIAKRRSYS
jgi:hypothetical protein